MRHIFAAFIVIYLHFVSCLCTNYCRISRKLYIVCILSGGVVVLLVEYRTCEQEVVGLSLGRARGIETLGNFSHMCATHVGTGQRAVMPCGWGVKAGMVCVWVAGKTV